MIREVTLDVPLGEGARVALYYAPAPDDPLWHAGTTWLGRDPATGAALPQPDLPDMAAVTAEARRYGFHATLKPPMRLRAGSVWGDVLASARAVARTLAPFDLPPLDVTDLSGFLALCETTPSPALRELADAFVAGLDAHRAPPTEAELARRRTQNLSAEQQAMLARWGYPDVFATWRFHLTLTRRLDTAERVRYAPAARAHFAPSLARPRRVTDVCLFVQAAPGAPFTLAARLPLGQRT